MKPYYFNYTCRFDLDNDIGLSDDIDMKIRQIRNDCESIIHYFLNEYGTIRQCADNTGIPKTTIHRLIYTYIRYYYHEEYEQIIKLLNYNKTYRRKPRKYHSKFKEF